MESSEKTKEIVRLYQSNCTLSQIAKKLRPLSREKVKLILQENGISLRRTTTKKINEKYFDVIDTPNKAYFLGMLFADGCVYEMNGRIAGFRITLKKSDRIIVDEFAKSIESDYKVSDLIRSDCEDQVSTAITNFHLAKRLNELGCTPRKSLTAKFPTLPDSMLPHFIRGYYDGDGSISSSHKHYVYPCVTMCASLEFSNHISELFKTLGITSHVYFCRNIWKIAFYKRNAMKLLDYIYTPGEFCLPRKHNRYLFFKQYYDHNGYGKIWRPLRQKAWSDFRAEELRAHATIISR